MAQTLNIDNFGSLNVIEETKLDADSALSAQAFTVQNNQGYAANDYFLVGARGGEASDLLVVSSVAGAATVNSTAAAKHAHNKFDQVTRLFGNQIQVYRAPNVNGSQPADSAFSTLGSPVSIDYDQLFTTYTDASGGSDYWYKFVYWNSTTGLGTSLADSTAVRGGDVGNYASLESIRKEAGMQNNRWITDAQIDEKRQAAQSLINSTLSGMYSVPFVAPVNPLIQEITRLYAAGLLLTDDYGPANRLNTAEGQKKLNQVTNDQGTGLLDKLNTKKLVLVGLLGEDDSVPGAGGFNAWPDSTTAAADTADGGGARMFKVEDRY